MKKLSNIREIELSKESFERFPVWVWDDDRVSHHPLSVTGPLPMGVWHVVFRFNGYNGFQGGD